MLAFSQDPDVQGEPIYGQSDGMGTPFQRNETVCFVLKMGAVGGDLVHPTPQELPFEVNVSTQNLINRTVEFITSTDSYLDENFFTVNVPVDPGAQINFSQIATIPIFNYSWYNVCGTVPETATDGSIVGYQANGDPGGYSNNQGSDDPSNQGTVQGILPIELLSFTATANNADADLDWKTATELNNSHFEVQRSADGRNFENIGRVAGNGTTSEVINYDFTDQEPSSGKNYYRLKQVDFDGSFDYSPVEVVTFDGSSDHLKVYPNPVSPGSELNIQGQKIRTVKIYNMLGQLVVDKVYDRPQTSVTISSANLAQGIYTTRVNGVDEKRVVIK